MSLGREQPDVADTAVHFPDAPTPALSVAGSNDRCVNCNAALASDQRYCVNCGERRGKPRFTLAGDSGETTETTAAVKPPRRARTSAGFNLIAGVATLLLAMGVGVLIGHNSGSSNSKATGTPATQVITVGGGASANTSSTAAAGTGGSGAKTSSHGAKGKAASGKAAAPKVVVQKAAAAASKVTGGSAKTAGATVTQGGQCASGSAGCENGHFTGNNFFGQ